MGRSSFHFKADKVLSSGAETAFLTNYVRSTENVTAQDLQYTTCKRAYWSRPY